MLLRQLIDFRENRRAERDDAVCDAGHGQAFLACVKPPIIPHRDRSLKHIACQFTPR
jgi:hypothetical protein